jgi:hypothetical protein
MVSSGASPKLIAQRLGHASPTITLSCTRTSCLAMTRQQPMRSQQPWPLLLMLKARAKVTRM